MKEKILAVIRESTDHQDTESQKREMKVFCMSLGFAEENIVYIESAGASARKANAKYLKMLDDIKNTLLNDPDMNTCAFWHLNRLGRRKEYITMMEAWFVQNKIQVYVKEPSLKLLDDNGNEDANASISFSVFSAMVELDTKEMFAKFKRGKEQNKLNGKWSGGCWVRFGYMVDDNGYIVPNPVEAKIIKSLFEEYATGKYSTISLAREFDKRGVIIRDSKITGETLRRVFKEKAYIGEDPKVHYSGIIDKKLWEKVQLVKKGKESVRYNKTIRTGNHLALKILKCNECGGNYIYSQSKYWCYHMRERSKLLDPSTACKGGPVIHADKLDALLWDITQDVYLDVNGKMNKKVKKECVDELKVVKQKIDTLQEKINMVIERQNRNNDLYINGDIDKSTYEKNKGKINKNKEDMMATMSIYNNDMKRLNTMISNYDKGDYISTACVGLKDDMTAQEKYDMVHKYITRVSLEFDKSEGASYKSSIITIQTVAGVYIYKYIPVPKRGEVMFYLKTNTGWRMKLV